MASGTACRVLIRSLFCLSLLYFSSASPATAETSPAPPKPTPVRIGIVLNSDKPELAVFKEVLASPKTDLSKWWYRFPSASAVQRALTAQLLAYGGLNADIRYVRYPTHKRLIEQLTQGKIHIAAETLWGS
ncbi:hypothetical protein [Agaribacterium haliotis]|uniref:hypothetical protein n=1 Tax=Agaribacterium haliotis TaxID=2013869 RepID=UPI001178281B|nr:hypothetical protein [Agaribacterium haliotis]